MSGELSFSSAARFPPEVWGVLALATFIAADSDDESTMGQPRWGAAAVTNISGRKASKLGPRAKLQKVSVNTDDVASDVGPRVAGDILWGDSLPVLSPTSSGVTHICGRPGRRKVAARNYGRGRGRLSELNCRGVTGSRRAGGQRAAAILGGSRLQRRRVGSCQGAEALSLGGVVGCLRLFRRRFGGLPGGVALYLG